MATIAELLESELKAALEVKSETALHNYVSILVGSLVKREMYMEEIGTLRSDVRMLIESMREGFRLMDERFVAMDKRFEAVDKRFEAVDERFEAVDERFEAVDERFIAMDKRFEAVDKRFEAVDKRFDDMNNRFADLIGQMNSRFNMMFIFMSGGFTVITVLLTLYRFIG
jgi:tetrahydromethanopterin S-methyltransferase subunit G